MSFIVVYICDLEPEFDTFFCTYCKQRKIFQIYLIKKTKIIRAFGMMKDNWWKLYTSDGLYGRPSLLKLLEKCLFPTNVLKILQKCVNFKPVFLTDIKITQWKLSVFDPCFITLYTCLIIDSCWISVLMSDPFFKLTLSIYMYYVIWISWPIFVITL